MSFQCHERQSPLSKRRRNDAAFRAEALRLAGESRSTQAAPRALNSDPKRLYKWHKEALTPMAAARGAELDPATAAELRQLRAANRRQAQELDILKKAIASACLKRRLSQTPDPMSCYRFVEAQLDHYPGRLLCQLLRVPASGYYAWQKAPLRAAMRRRGLRALQPKAFTPRTTDSTHGLRCAPNRLLDRPKPTQGNRVWVSDITYLPLANGSWAYLCAFQDQCTKHVVGWHVGAMMPEELVTTALQRALLAQTPTPGPIVHSDRSGQNGGNAYRTLLHEHGAIRSQC